MPQDVHLVPMLREADRALLPFVPRNDRPPLLHAHRIHLLVADNDVARRLAARVERQLRRIADVDTTTLSMRPSDGEFEQLLGVFSQLIRREVAEGHRVHVNLSSGSKLLALAAGLAAMAHLPRDQGSLYYVRPEGYLVTESEFEEHGTSKGLASVEPLEVMPLVMPAALQLRVLAFLKTRARAVEYRDVLRFLAAVPGSGYDLPADRRAARRRRWTNTTTTRMVRAVLTPLQGLGLLEIVTHGREKSVKLTARGSLYAAISALSPAELRAPL